MIEEEPCKYINISPQEIIDKRLGLILEIWDHLVANGIIDNNAFHLSLPLIHEVVAHYVDDVKAIKCRYKIQEKIQLHKVAGLMAASLMRYRPITPRSKHDEFRSKKEIYVNEIFSVFHGLAVCGEYHPGTLKEFSQEAWFDPWLNDFIYVLHSRNFTPEGLILIFQTLSIFKFPNNFIQADGTKT